MNVSAVGHPYTYTHTLSFSGCISCGETFCNTPQNDDVTSNNNNNNTTTKKSKKNVHIETHLTIWHSVHNIFISYFFPLFSGFSFRFIFAAFDMMDERRWEEGYNLYWSNLYWTSTCTLNIDDIIVKLCIFWAVYISLRYTKCNVLYWTKGCMISSEIECAPPNSKYNLITLFESL